MKSLIIKNTINNAINDFEFKISIDIDRDAIIIQYLPERSTNTFSLLVNEKLKIGKQLAEYTNKKLKIKEAWFDPMRHVIGYAILVPKREWVTIFERML